MNAFLDPDVFAAIEHLELRAGAVVEGFISGHHRSPFHGFSVEFADYRGYTPGDDVRHIDWRMYARTGRYYIKQYELETNMVCSLLVDMSRSMDFRSPEAHGGLSKLDYARTMTAALALLVLRQSDAAGLALFDRDTATWIRPSSKPGHIQAICRALEQAVPTRDSDIGASLRGLADRLPPRGMVVLVTDAFDDVAATAEGLQRLRMRGHEVILFHLLDAQELDFPFHGYIQFEGLEGGTRALCNPRQIRAQYLEELERFQRELRAACHGAGATYQPVDTRTGLDVVLASYLARRARSQRGRSA